MENMSITHNQNGSITVSKPIHDNWNDLFKMTYYDYSEEEAIEKFQSDFIEAESRTFINIPAEEETPFNATGTYQISNCIGYYVEIHPSGDSARLKLGFDDKAKITDWLEIEYVENDLDYIEDETTEEDYPIRHAVIDPEGYCVPLSLVMRL